MSSAYSMIYATMYAADKNNKARCMDKQVTEGYGKVKWISTDESRIYPCPNGLECESGNCVIADKETCHAVSSVPYDSSGNSIATTRCSADTDCADSESCDKAHNDDGSTDTGRCVSSRPYLEWRNTNDGKGKVCAYGNAALRKWCRYPAKRHSGETVVGVTDVPPFDYSEADGQCRITGDYCTSFVMDFDQNASQGPTCTTGPGQKAGEFFLGKTIFRYFKGKNKKVGGDGEGNSSDDRNEGGGGNSSLTDLADVATVQRMADEQYMTAIRLMKTDVGGPGVHLYMVTWHEAAARLDPACKGTTVSFLAGEVEAVRPSAVRDVNGAKHIVITAREMAADKSLRRIGAMSSVSKWMTQTVMQAEKTVEYAQRRSS